MDPRRPHRTGAPPRVISLTGKIFPWNPSTQQPWYIHIGETPDLYLACFSEAPALRAVMARIGVTGYTIKLIQDDFEFRSSIPSRLDAETPLHLILDPTFDDNGRSRFTQILGRD
jgi:hypothetical protein